MAKEAKKRGLNNVKTTPQALDFYVTNAAKKLFVSNGIFTETELDARYHIQMHNYILKLQIESAVLKDLAMNHIIPATVNYQNVLIQNVKGLKEIGLKEPAFKAQKELITKISTSINGINEQVNAMGKEIEKAEALKDDRKRAIAYCDKVKLNMDAIRAHADAIEETIDDDYWPLPKYREMLFMR